MTIEINVSASGTPEGIPSHFAKKFIEFIETIDIGDYVIELNLTSPIIPES